MILYKYDLALKAREELFIYQGRNRLTGTGFKRNLIASQAVPGQT